MGTKGNDSWKINTLINASSVLRLFTGKEPFWSFNEIFHELKMPKSTLSNMLRTLEYIKFIEKDDQTQLYHLAIDVLEMSFSARKSFSIIETANSLLDEIQKKTSNIVYFTVPKDGKVLYLDASYPSNKSISYSVTGKTLPMHCTGVGKAMLSRMKINDIKKIIDFHGMPQFTGTTITDFNLLIQELKETKNRGFAIDNGEEAYGVRCIAVPITSGDTILGAISISGSTFSIKEEDFDRYASILMDAANHLSQFSHLFPKTSIMPK